MRGDFRSGEWKDGIRIRWISEAYRDEDKQASSGKCQKVETTEIDNPDPEVTTSDPYADA